MCKHCLQWENEGTICLLFPSEADFKNSKYYNGEDNVKGDPIAKKAVWIGKNNIGRKNKDWWICTPVHPNCLSVENRIVTENGLRYYNEIKKTDLVLSLNPLTLETEYSKIRKIIQYNYSGSLVHFNAKGYNLRTTLDHNMFIAYEDNGIFKTEFIQASDLLNFKTFYIPDVREPSKYIEFTKDNVSTENYNGIVWCVDLEKNHIFQYENNNVYGFTGNCSHSWQSYDPDFQLDEDIKDFGIDLLAEQAEQNKRYRERNKSEYAIELNYIEETCSCENDISIEEWVSNYLKPTV